MKLSTYLQGHSLTPADLARKIGVTEKAVSHWLSGARTPRPEQMVKIVEATGSAVTPNDFLPSDTNDQARKSTDNAPSYTNDEAA